MKYPMLLACGFGAIVGAVAVVVLCRMGIL